MKHRFLSFCIGTSLIAGTAEAQLQRIVLQGSGAPQVFTDIYDAVAAAQPNDKLYFSGGTFLADSGLTLSMPLHFIGAGIHPDSTNVAAATILTTNGSEGRAESADQFAGVCCCIGHGLRSPVISSSSFWAGRKFGAVSSDSSR